MTFFQFFLCLDDKKKWKNQIFEGYARYNLQKRAAERSKIDDFWTPK